MTYFCPDCCIAWFPYMTNGGACPECGGGTRRTNEPVSPDADARWQTIKAKRASADRHERFERYNAEREAKRAGATT